jgi:hypothetical protein
MSEVITPNPLKTLSVTGKLNTFVFSENVCLRNCDLSVGNWAINIADIALSYPKDFSISTTLLFDIKCNLVQSYSFNQTKTVSLTSVSLLKFFIDSKPTTNVTYLPQRWFNINNASEIITITLIPWPEKKTLSKAEQSLVDQISICFTVLFKRLN